MKCIKSSYKILIQKNSINDIYKQIELAEPLMKEFTDNKYI